MLVLAILLAVVLVAFAGNACPTDLPERPCPEAGANRATLVALLAGTALLAVTPFAFLAEFAARGRIVYRGAWGRALRRGLLAALVIAALAGLRLGGALSVPTTLFMVIMAALLEWFAVRRFDLP